MGHIPSEPRQKLDHLETRLGDINLTKHTGGECNRFMAISGPNLCHLGAENCEWGVFLDDNTAQYPPPPRPARHYRPVIRQTA